jgi:Cu(I)/Ag(I) efflux system membrane fusion protein
MSTVFLARSPTMSAHNSHSRPEPVDNGHATEPTLSRTEGGLRAPPGLGLLGRAWWWFHFLVLVKLARLRFIAVLALVGLVILKWETLNAYYEKWTRPAATAAAAAAGTEYYCPMHPQVVRDHHDKCPICGMPLSQRKKRDAVEGEGLPPGVITRVQLTPYRMALAGIQTSQVGYRPLVKEIRTVGSVEFDERKLRRITARVTGKSRIDKLHVNVTGQLVRQGDPLAELYSPDLVVTIRELLEARRAGSAELERMARGRLRLWGLADDQVADIVKTGRPVTHVTIRSPMTGHVLRKYQVEGEYVEEGARLYDLADLSTVWIEAQVYEDELGFIHEGQEVSATVEKAFPSRVFHGTVAFIHPHLDAATRTLRVRFDVPNPDHALRPGMYATVRLEAPAARLITFSTALREDWRTATALAPLAEPAPGLRPLLEAAVRQALLDLGLVRAVPESAVIDTGSHRFVYRQAWPGTYDCVEAQLGPRAGDFYAVVRGLEAGDRVVTAGSFLVDAETRLTGGLASTYFGASGGPASGPAADTAAPRPSQTQNEDAAVQVVLAKLSRADRQLAEAQGSCPVLGGRLGGMGLPVKLFLKGQPVFLCCQGCEREARAEPERILADVKSRRKGSMDR